VESSVVGSEGTVLTEAVFVDLFGSTRVSFCFADGFGFALEEDFLALALVLAFAFGAVFLAVVLALLRVFRLRLGLGFGSETSSEAVPPKRRAIFHLFL
jgi:hypothetical protein